MFAIMRQAVTLVLLALLADATQTSMKGDCNKGSKALFSIKYCKSFTCDKCCDLWCKDKCDDMKKKMEKAGCSCEGDPKAHTDKSFCEGKEKDFKSEHKDDAWEDKQAAACSRGCKACCSKKDFKSE